MKRILKSFRRKSGKSKKGIPVEDEQQQIADSMAELNAFYEEETGLVDSQGAVETTTGTNASGRRVTTTTVQVPPTVEKSGTRISASGEEAASTTTDLTRDLVKRFISDIWNCGDISLIPSVCSPSLRFNGNTGERKLVLVKKIRTWNCGDTQIIPSVCSPSLEIQVLIE